MFGNENKGRRWLQFDDGSFEPRDPYEDLRVRRQKDSGADFWEVEKPSDWLPDEHKYRKPRKTELEPGGLLGESARKPEKHRNCSLLTGGGPE